MGKQNVKDAEQDVSTLNQGQGPEFQTEDQQGREHNQGINQPENQTQNLEGDEGGGNVTQLVAEESTSSNPNGSTPSASKPNDEQENTTSQNNEETQQDLPSREREGVDYIGDNPEETREEAPHLER